MGKAIGIDLGTTNSVAAFKLASVEVVTAQDNRPPDRKLTPSVVTSDQDHFLVGEAAYNQLRHHPENVIVSIKRLMGRGFNDLTVQKQQAELAYKITQPSQGTDNSIVVWLNGKEYQPEDISAQILQKVVENAQIYRQKISNNYDIIDQVVITIPAYFNDQQRYATRNAAIKAGLTPLELLPEPTAAAISYGFSPNSNEVKTILVYDFGGGTFDASVITAAGTSFIEQGKAGDLWLGGDDIDSRLIKFVKQQVAKQEKIHDIDDLISKMPDYQKIRFNADLKVAVERAKVELSHHIKARINPTTQLLDELGMVIPVEVEITRHQFEEMISDLIDRTLQICHEALKYSQYHLEMIDVVLLVGGSSQIPLVQNKVKQVFGANKVVVHPRPMYAVAEGAAIVAAGQTDKVMTVSRDYYIQLLGRQDKVIHRGDILPITTSHTFKTVADGQRLIHFKFFSPDNVKEQLDGIKNYESIGDMWLGLDQSYPAGTEITVYLELDEKNSDLKMTATLKNDPSVKVSCNFSHGRADEKIYKELEMAINELNKQDLTAFGVEEALKLAVPVVQSANFIKNPVTGEEYLDILERTQESLHKFQVYMSPIRLETESLINECDRILKLCDFMIHELQQERLQNLSQQLKLAINSNNLSAMEYHQELCKRELRNLPNSVQLVQGCILAIEQAKLIAPTQANAMSQKLSRMLNAAESHDKYEVVQLWQELLPDVQHWLNQELPTNSIITGLTR